MTDATDWRVEYPFVVVNPDTEEEVRADRAGAASSSASRSSRAAAAPATPAARFRSTRLSAVINTEKLEALSADRGARAARASTEPCPVDPLRRGRRHARVMEAAEARGPRVRVRSTSADASCIGGNVAMNAGGKKAVLWGTALDNLASWRMVTPDARVARWSSASTTTSARSTTRRSRASACTRYRGRRQARLTSEEMLEIPGQRLPQGGPRQGRHRQVPRRPARRAEGRLRRHHHLGDLHPAPHAASTCAPSASSSSATCTRRCRRSSRSSSYLDAQPGGASLAGLEHLDERYVKAVGYATKAQRRGRPEMVLIGDIVGEDEDAVARAASHVVRIANARGAEGFIAVTPSSASASGSTARAPPRSRSTPTRSRSTRTW